MKVIFVGPTLAPHERHAGDCAILPPAAQGDIARAVLGGATVIGLIDGVYETIAAVWHKEILFALARGVRVLGAASMGALRAAECAAFGMEPVGEIANRYLSGTLDDDAAVAVLHAPLEMDYLPLSEALVDAEATIAHLCDRQLISAAEAKALQASAAGCFFKQRTAETIVVNAGAVAPGRRATVLAAYRLHRIGLKRRDALLLIRRIAAINHQRLAVSPDWTLSQPPSWRQLMADLDPALQPALPGSYAAADREGPRPTPPIRPIENTRL
jgi:hypothetical protein